jgi:hypothetical protein
MFIVVETIQQGGHCQCNLLTTRKLPDPVVVVVVVVVTWFFIFTFCVVVF